MNTASDKIIELRELLAEKFPPRPLQASGHLSSGLPVLDETLAGGLPMGAITEITSTRGSGLVLASLLQSAARADAFTALIDGRDSLDPDGFDQWTLARLLWVRCKSARDAVRAADLILRDGNLPLVILDLRSNSFDELRNIPLTRWYRLQHVVEQISTAFVILTRRSMIATARVRLIVDGDFTLDAFERRQTDLTIELEASFSEHSRERLRQFA